MESHVRKILFIVFLATAVAGCGEKHADETEKDFTKITNVEIYTVRPAAFEDYIHLPVVVAPNKQINLGLTSGGRVTKVYIDKGDNVSLGMTLLKTDDVLIKSAYDIAKANLEYQKKEFARSEKLLREGSISEAVYDGAKLAFSQAQGSFDQAKKQYEDTKLEAPFSGTVTSRNVEVGDILGPGTPAFRIIDVSRVKVQAGIPEKYIIDFRVGNNVKVTFDAIPGKIFEGKINYISPEASASVRTFLAEIVVDNPDRLIRAGIMGDSHILRKLHENALMVPLNAIIDTQDGRIVFVAGDDNTAEKRAVEISGNSETAVQIISGLTPGDRVIVKGQHDLVDGEIINITGEYMAVSGEGSAQ